MLIEREDGLFSTELNRLIEDYNDGYYHVFKDLHDYPDLFCLNCFSARSRGKTYGFFMGCYLRKFENCKFIYIKRTIDDVNFICSNDNDVDCSPLAPINRDFGCNFRPKLLNKGIAAVYPMDEENEPCGDPVGFIIALSAAKKIKGFELSNYCDLICVDEYIPQSSETGVRKLEGETLMDIVMTCRRDRTSKNKPEVKLILFANAENISCPISNSLNMVDMCFEICSKGISHMYDEERKFLLHHITKEEIALTDEFIGGVGAFMKGTAWYAKSFDGEFSNNDFTNIATLSLKGFKAVAKLQNKTQIFYLLEREKDNMFYLTDRLPGQLPKDGIPSYNFNRESEAMAFYQSILYGSILNHLINDKCKFEKYSYYDVLKNFKKYYI